MAKLPVIVRLEIENYGLYPQQESTSIETDRGLTLVVGANGIGKTTLVSLMFRMLTGPFDVPAARGSSLGGGSLEVKPLDPLSKRYFSRRVRDGASDATSTIRFKFGEGEQFSVRRRLKDLALLDAHVGDRDVAVQDTEKELQQLIVGSANLGSYSDWILLLRYVVFSQEDRQSLLWDEVAQRQILRPLFLSPSESNDWAKQERELFALDSQRRNAQASATKLERWLADDRKKRARLGSIEGDLATLLQELATLREEDQASEPEFEEAEKGRKASRLAYLTREEELQSAASSYEAAKLNRILQAYPDANATAQYIAGRLMATDSCLACGEAAGGFRTQLAQRIDVGACPVCGSVLPASDPTDMPLPEAVSRLTAVLEQVEASKSAAEEDESRYRAVIDARRRRRSRMLELEEQIAAIEKQMPEQSEVSETRNSELEFLESKIEEFDAKLESMRESFKALTERTTTVILERASAIEARFRTYAESFLMEESQLTWSRKKVRIGQMGSPVPVPNFSLDMGGTDFEGTTRREAADSVSESQREYIDLAFRMALVDLASVDGATLVIDSPDSSLDAVFEDKAATVLSKFAARDANTHLIVTTNISSGDFVPELVRQFRACDSRPVGLVDLFEIGVATAAVRELHSEYEVERARLFERIRGV